MSALFVFVESRHQIIYRSRRGKPGAAFRIGLEATLHERLVPHAPEIVGEKDDILRCVVGDDPDRAVLQLRIQRAHSAPLDYLCGHCRYHCLHPFLFGAEIGTNCSISAVQKSSVTSVVPAEGNGNI